MRSGRCAIAEPGLSDDGLTALARLALAYAPAPVREDWWSVLALDARLAGVVRGAREPMLGQLRLAWWRDRLTSDPADWPRGEPLLARLAGWGGNAKRLAGLVDGWESLLGEAPLDAAALEEFAAGRASAMRALAGRLGSDAELAAQGGHRWGLADLVLHCADRNEREVARNLLEAAGTRRPVLREMRPLAVLTGLSERAVRRGHAEALSGPGALFAALRIGFAGR